VKWKLIVRAKALRELEDAADWYGIQRAELKAEFIASVKSSLTNLAKNPRLNARRLKKRDIRWLRPERFPYRLVYEIRKTESIIVVIAVLHSSRNDAHWHRRLGEQP
jgi:toxin ParE1/3/4